MKRILNKAKSNSEAEKWDIMQQLKMTPEERMAISLELKKRFYGKNVPDVRESKKFNIHYIGLDSLIKNKEAVNRYRDKDDLQFLKALKRNKN
jgi:hypothetical protein